MFSDTPIMVYIATYNNENGELTEEQQQLRFVNPTIHNSSDDSGDPSRMIKRLQTD